ncbi:SgcJ/EcaC family oxidoreductase [Streptomyces sp. NPDC056304]|uniref:nuclear transport factor 2 family protein n=1 Tax=Streptomyces sp. NPDC056304 TaxID=3345778 RepID=UPI0035E187D3
MTIPETIVDRQLAAYNSHDLEAFAATYAPDVCINRRSGDRLLGRDAVREEYTDMFAKGRCRAEIVGRVIEGEWVVDHEIAHGITNDPLRVLVAYRVRDGLIDHVDFLG